MSRFLAPALLLLCAACAAVSRAQPTLNAPNFAFTHVNVVDVESGHVLPDQTVLIAGNRVQALGAEHSRVRSLGGLGGRKGKVPDPRPLGHACAPDDA